MNKQQRKLWREMILVLDNALVGLLDFSSMVKNLEGLLDAGGFSQNLAQDWHSYWGPLEVLYTRNNKIKPQDAKNEIKAMRDFLVTADLRDVEKRVSELIEEISKCNSLSDSRVFFGDLEHLHSELMKAVVQENPKPKELSDFLRSFLDYFDYLYIPGAEETMYENIKSGKRDDLLPAGWVRAWEARKNNK